MDDAVVGRRAPGEVGGDLLMRLRQHGIAAVHVADGVEPHALRSACLAQSHSSFSRSFGRHGRATTSWKWIATMRVLVIENYFGTTLGQVGAALDEAGVTTDIRRVWDGGRLPPGPHGYDGLVVLGGEQSAVDDAEHPYLPRVAALTKAFGEADKAVLGICLGAQLVARGHGATNILGRPIEFGWQKVAPTEAGRDDPVLSALGDGAPLFHWHLDTFTLPPGATHLATSAMTDDAGLPHRPRGLRHPVPLRGEPGAGRAVEPRLRRGDRRGDARLAGAPRPRSRPPWRGGRRHRPCHRAGLGEACSLKGVPGLSCKGRVD